VVKPNGQTQRNIIRLPQNSPVSELSAHQAEITSLLPILIRQRSWFTLVIQNA